MRGTIVLDNAPGRALRKAPAAVHVRDVLWCAGEFRAGDPVHLSFRGADGGQGAVATGIAACDAAELRRRTGPASPPAPASADAGGEDVIVREQDVELLWPRA